jgi:hypothetical protein
MMTHMRYYPVPADIEPNSGRSPATPTHAPATQAQVAQVDVQVPDLGHLHLHIHVERKVLLESAATHHSGSARRV